jgi:hypothetical protein
MNIEQELEEWLKKSISDKKKNKSRDMKVILSRYGFGRLHDPTLEELAIEFQVGSRERIRQVINDNFKNVVKLQNLPAVKETINIIESHDHISISELQSELISKGLASTNTKIRGLLNLADDFNEYKDSEIYNIELETLSRSDDESKGEFYLIESKTHERLKAILKKTRTLPGQLGLANFDYLTKFGDATDVERVIKLIRCTSNVCVVQHDDSEWYIYEERDNTLLNSCEKIFSLTNECDISILSSTLENSLYTRTNENKYPSSCVIKKWIEQSRWFEIKGEGVTFLGDKRELTEIEQAAVNYLQSVKKSDSPSFKAYLSNKGYGEPAIVKITFYSPLITVDKSDGRKTYTFQLISEAAKIERHSVVDLDDYDIVKNKLKKLLNTGTDANVASTSRREQATLQKWLFSEKSVTDCAICGDSFSVSALVTAHKKKRSRCTDAERVDPYIVFPLCIFGCDFLYENDFIRIVDGVVWEGHNFPDYDCADKRRALSLFGRKLEDQWLKGSKHYFER